MGHVFVSYARGDADIVQKVVRELDGARLGTWIDREDIPGGARWRTQIVDAIERATAVVIALSPRSVESDNVRKEIDLAENARKPIVPVFIRHAIIPNHMLYQLIGLQQIDLTADFALGVRQLVDALRRLVVSPQTFASLSPQARNAIKQLASNSALSTVEKMAEVASLFAQESARMGESKLAAVVALNERAVQRMELKDKFHLAGNHSGIQALVAEGEEDKRQMNLILSQDEEMAKIFALVRSQLEALNRRGAESMRQLFGDRPKNG